MSDKSGLFRRAALFGVLFTVLLPVAAQAASREKLDERANRAGEVFRELREAPDRRVPADLLSRSRCVAAIPNVIKAAWVLGGRYGRGLLSCRTKTGEWSPPVHVMLTGGSFGFQFGASSTDVVLFFMTVNSVRSLLTNNIKLSGDVGIAAGPIGRETEAATDAKFRAEIYSYARSRGLFAGVSLAGSYLGVDYDDNARYYGKRYSTTGILFDHKVTSVPKSAWSFLNTLPQPRRATSSTAPSFRKDIPPSDSRAMVGPPEPSAGSIESENLTTPGAPPDSPPSTQDIPPQPPRHEPLVGPPAP